MIPRHQQEQSDYSEAWKEPETIAVDDDQQDSGGGTKTLAEQIEDGEGTKLAAGDGFKGDGAMTTQEHKAYREATGENINGSPTAAAPKPQEASYSQGKDDKTTSEWKSRVASSQNEDGIQKLMKLRGVTRDQAVKMMQAH